VTKEALRLALEALGEIEWSNNSQWQSDRAKVAITAIKEALAQPEQEPVAWIYKGEKSFDGNKYSDEYELTASKQVALWKDKNAKPLYTTPPQRKPLSDEEIRDAVRESDLDWHQGWTLDDDEPNRFISLARAIEAAHGIKGEA